VELNGAHTAWHLDGVVRHAPLYIFAVLMFEVSHGPTGARISVLIADARNIAAIV
jgi:hypothetical protein